MNKLDIKQPEFSKLGIDVINCEIEAIIALKSQINDNFNLACEALLCCTGRIVVIGMGKSGHIASKIAATFSSTGSPACFLHPSEASHGDIGMLTENDVVIMLSNSGATPEVVSIIPPIKRLGIICISVTGNADSILANASDISLTIKVEKEACPLGLAPTSSTTSMLVLGDALAIALLQAKGFTKDDFANTHPGGNLGKKLLLHVSDIMKSGDSIPQVLPDTLAKEALLEMTAKKLGFTGIVDQNKKVLGIFTDGDLRRAFNQAQDFTKMSISDLMHADCKVFHDDSLAVDALQLMKKHKINSALVVNKDNLLVGALTMHHLIEAGI